MVRAAVECADAVARFYAQIEEQRIDDLMRTLHEDCVWQVIGAPEHVPWHGRFEGPHGVAQYFERVSRHLDPLGVQIDERWIDGERAMVFGQEQARVRTTGHVFTSPFAHRLHFAHGRLTAFTAYGNSAAQLVAVEAL